MGGVGALSFISPIGAVAQTAVGDLVTELSSFTKFRERIDELLRSLKESPAAPAKLGEVSIGLTQFGDPAWMEASGLHAAYKEVVSELETLSKLLSDSIEGLSIAVLAAHKGYENLDEDIRARMLAIKNDTQAHYKGEYNPVPEEGKPGSGKSAVAKSTPGGAAGGAGI
ncbi:hypothetical protein [Streptomyces sp. PTD5-9]|uniref:hypothetical protein n=1 Tax=Streptomyces sp. PTD5-9 TaxID=3120150 RepID=UPI0030095E4B